MSDHTANPARSRHSFQSGDIKKTIGGIPLEACENRIMLQMERCYILGEIGADELDRFFVALEAYLVASRAVRS